MAVIECHYDISAEMVRRQAGYNGMHYDQKRGKQGIDDLNLLMKAIKCMILSLESPRLLHRISSMSSSTFTLLRHF